MKIKTDLQIKVTLVAILLMVALVFCPLLRVTTKLTKVATNTLQTVVTMAETVELKDAKTADEKAEIVDEFKELKKSLTNEKYNRASVSNIRFITNISDAIKVVSAWANLRNIAVQTKTIEKKTIENPQYLLSPEYESDAKKIDEFEKKVEENLASHPVHEGSLKYARVMLRALQSLVANDDEVTFDPDAPAKTTFSMIFAIFKIVMMLSVLFFLPIRLIICAVKSLLAFTNKNMSDKQRIKGMKKAYKKVLPWIGWLLITAAFWSFGFTIATTLIILLAAALIVLNFGIDEDEKDDESDVKKVAENA